MRKWVVFEEPVSHHGFSVRKIMVYRKESGETSVFLYAGEDAQICSADEYYPSLEDALDAWDSLPHTAWIPIADPLPECQEDAFDPIRIKGRTEGKPEWGRYEILRNGVWQTYEE